MSWVRRFLEVVEGIWWDLTESQVQPQRTQPAKPERRHKADKVAAVLFHTDRLGATKLDPKELEVMLMVLTHVVRSRMRRIDDIWKSTRSIFWVVLDKTDFVGAQVFIRRVEAAVDELLRGLNHVEVVSRSVLPNSDLSRKVPNGTIGYVFPEAGLATCVAEWPRGAGLEAEFAKFSEALEIRSLGQEVFHEVA